MGRDERWSRLGSVLYIVSKSFLIIYGIIWPNHPDPDDFTLSTGNMSEVLVRTKNCRYSKGSNIEVPDAYRATSSTGCYSKMHHGMDVMEGNAVYCISYHDFLKHLNIANSVCWYMIASWLQQWQALYWASKLHSPRKKEGFNPEVDRAPTHICVCVWEGGTLSKIQVNVLKYLNARKY